MIKQIRTILCFNQSKIYARHYLVDYNCGIHSPHCLELIEALELVQRHFTKILHGFNNLSYGDWLNIVG